LIILLVQVFYQRRMQKNELWGTQNFHHYFY
jgi:hypothetical protein